MTLLLVGLSHHSASLEVRERLNCTESRLPDALARLAACPDVREAALLSTCNRMEIYAVAADPEAAAAELCRAVAAFHDLPESRFQSHLYIKTGAEAAHHLFRVAGGLDSLVLGEAQIVGQVRDALRVAQETGTTGGTLNALFQGAIVASRRIQNETALGRGAFSIGRAAVDLASRIFADLSTANVLLLGAGKMSELTAKHLVANGVRLIVVANRTHERAVAMAERLGGTAIQYDAFPDALAAADIVIASTAAPHPIIRKDTLLPVLRRRRGKPLFLIDIAVPRDIAADVADLENVFLRNLDDLQAVVADETKERQQEAVQAERVVTEEAEKFLVWLRGREAAPVITQMSDRLERIRQDDLALLRGKLSHLSETEWQAIETATRAMMRHVAREPILRLKRETENSAAGSAGQYDLIAAVREIFQLETQSDSENSAAQAAIAAPARVESFAADTEREKAGAA